MSISRNKNKASRLHLDDVKMVNEFYTYKGKNSLEVIKRCINERPSSTLYDINGNPISWVLVKDDGSMVIMYTREENRGKGLTAYVSVSLVEEIILKVVHHLSYKHQ